MDNIIGSYIAEATTIMEAIWSLIGHICLMLSREKDTIEIGREKKLFYTQEYSPYEILPYSILILYSGIQACTNQWIAHNNISPSLSHCPSLLFLHAHAFFYQMRNFTDGWLLSRKTTQINR